MHSSNLKIPNTYSKLLALEGVSQASLFDELNAATPSWSLARVPGSTAPPSDGSTTVLSTMSAKTKDVLSSMVEKCEHSTLPPSLILNLVNCKFSLNLSSNGSDILFQLTLSMISWAMQIQETPPLILQTKIISIKRINLMKVYNFVTP